MATDYQYLDAEGLKVLLKGLDKRYGTNNSSARLSTARKIALSGDVEGSVMFDGSTNVTLDANIESISDSEIIELMNTPRGDQ